MEEQMESHTDTQTGKWQVCSRPCKGGMGAVPTKDTRTDMTKGRNLTYEMKAHFIFSLSFFFKLSQYFFQFSLKMCFLIQ